LARFSIFDVMVKIGVGGTRRDCVGTDDIRACDKIIEIVHEKAVASVRQVLPHFWNDEW